MQRKNLGFEASFEEPGDVAGQQQSGGPTERVSTRMEQGYSTPASLTRLALLAFKLCNLFLHRWFNLCEVGAEDLFYAFRMRRIFAGVDLEFVTAPQETATLDSRHLLEEHDFLQLDNSPDISGGRSQSAISWRTPWLYLVFLLLVWLLLF